MVPIICLLTLLFSFIPAPAAQQASGCFLPTSGAGQTNYQNCCSSKTGGKEYLDGIEYDYQCATWLEPSNPKSEEAGNAAQCARICHNDPDCGASAWASNQKCYLSPASTDLTYKTDPILGKGYISLNKTRATMSQNSNVSLDPTNDGCMFTLLPYYK
jgi:hypothetical protein